MRLFRLNTVKRKLMLLFTSLIFAISIFVYLYFPNKFNNQRINAINDKVSTVAQLTELSIGAGIFFNDSDVVKEEIKPLLKSNDIIYIVILDKDGSIVYQDNLDKAAKYHYQNINKTHISDDGSVFKEKMDVVFNGNVIGTLFLGYSLSGLANDVKEIKLNVAQVSILILLIGFVCINIIGNLITKPLKIVVDAAEEISKGDFSKRAIIQSNDEIGYLAKTFNQMVDNINSVNYQLAETNAGLELRSKELLETNKALQLENSQRKFAEEKIHNSLHEKEILLKEIHHRVKNNLQIISSLLYLNSKKIKDNESLVIFKESQNRIKSIALVHERLYQSKDLGKIDFKEYITRLTSDLFNSFSSYASLINLNLDIENIFISVEVAVPLGLITNELISNSLKYAFPNKENLANKPEIKICFNKCENNELILEISDNGIGMPEGFDLKTSQSLGLQLVETLINQLDGIKELDMNNGIMVRIKFKDEKSYGINKT